MMRNRAFTLVEVLAAIGIVVALIALVCPAILGARRQGMRVLSISNMRQCGIALLLYSEDHGGLRGMPTRPAADEVLRLIPTCDPRDYFRSSCAAPSPKPLIGSFAYVRDDMVFGDERGWNFYLSAHENSAYSPALLIDLFASNKRHQPGNWFGEYFGNPYPDQIQMFEADGGIRLYHIESRPSIGYTWLTLFVKR